MGSFLEVGGKKDLSRKYSTYSGTKEGMFFIQIPPDCYRLDSPLHRFRRGAAAALIAASDVAECSAQCHRYRDCRNFAFGGRLRGNNCQLSTLESVFGSDLEADRDWDVFRRARPGGEYCGRPPGEDGGGRPPNQEIDIEGSKTILKESPLSSNFMV